MCVYSNHPVVMVKYARVSPAPAPKGMLSPPLEGERNQKKPPPLPPADPPQGRERLPLVQTLQVLRQRNKSLNNYRRIFPKSLIILFACQSIIYAPRFPSKLFPPKKRRRRAHSNGNSRAPHFLGDEQHPPSYRITAYQSAPSVETPPADACAEKSKEQCFPFLNDGKIILWDKESDLAKATHKSKGFLQDTKDTVHGFSSRKIPNCWFHCPKFLC